MTIAGRAVPGGITLEFLQGRLRTLFGQLGEVFDHASNLTDGLVPQWLVWLIAIAVALCVPLAMVLALFLALREDEGAGFSSAPARDW